MRICRQCKYNFILDWLSIYGDDDDVEEKSGFHRTTLTTRHSFINIVIILLEWKNVSFVYFHFDCFSLKVSRTIKIRSVYRNTHLSTTCERQHDA